MNIRVTQQNQGFFVLGFVPQTPLASPYSPSGILRQALASPFGIRGDAARSLLPRRSTSRETARAQWLPNLPLLITN
ncbi:hypothetical protein [uncultured Nostoc sp.]|uniref:hypothetical protein n=1 Tax=uncultured Nostoc sp. TaxID=340711 RepID=UPI0035CA0E0F